MLNIIGFVVFVRVVNPYVVIVAIPYVVVTLTLRHLALSAGRELNVWRQCVSTIVLAAMLQQSSTCLYQVTAMLTYFCTNFGSQAAVPCTPMCLPVLKVIPLSGHSTSRLSSLRPSTPYRTDTQWHGSSFYPVIEG